MKNQKIDPSLNRRLQWGLPLGALCISVVAGCGGGTDASTQTTPVVAAYTSGNIVVSRTVYAGTTSTVAVGQTLPGGGAVATAVANGSFPDVFKNEVPDPSFGVSSPIFLDQRNANGAMVSTRTIDAALISSSFASKSELALNVSTDKSAITFMGYKGSVNQLDESNSNTIAYFDSTNPVAATVARAIAKVDLTSGSVAVIPVNSYSGNNGRAAILANGTYYMVGNAGNGSGDGNNLSALSDNTGVQSILATASGSTTPVGAVLGTFGSLTGYQRGFSLSQVPNPATPGTNYAVDKTGKDANFRGMTIFNNTLYVSKGSGSNGVNTVYQVGATGALANGATLSNATITILPGFNALSEKVAEAKATLTATPHPFGIWFADANTVFVADEGDGVRIGVTGKVTTFAGLGQYKLANGVWSLVANYQVGLTDQSAYTAGLPWNVKADGLRNISGKVNADGSYSIYGVTSTITDELTHDQGADPNQLVSITIKSSSTPANTSFVVLQSALSGERLGGVTIVP